MFGAFESPCVAKACYVSVMKCPFKKNATLCVTWERDILSWNTAKHVRTISRAVVLQHLSNGTWQVPHKFSFTKLLLQNWCSSVTTPTRVLWTKVVSHNTWWANMYPNLKNACTSQMCIYSAAYRVITLKCRYKFWKQKEEYPFSYHSYYAYSNTYINKSMHFKLLLKK